MTATVMDVLKANLVLVGVELLKREEELNAFQDAVHTEVAISASGLVIGPQPNASQTGRLLSLDRDRILLDTSQSRTTINRDYPSKEDLARLAQVAGHAIAKTEVSDQGLRAFGYNIELVYEQDSGLSALRYLGQRLFPSSLFNDIAWQTVGGSGRLFFEGNGEAWIAKIEPRFNDITTTRIFLSLNLNKGDQTLPGEESIKRSLTKAWDQANNFAHRLDESRR